MEGLRCPHCTSTAFDKNPLFLECAECGTRYVLDPDGSLRRTDAFGHGEGSRHDAGTHQGGHSTTYNYNVNIGGHPRNGAAAHENASPKSRTVALLLCIFLGFFGAHYFYVGRPKWGIIYLLTVGLFAYGWLFCIFWIAFGKFKDADDLLLTRWET